jgi:membrane associated rhomboid family serine protease
MESSGSLLGTGGKADDARDRKRHDGVFALVLINLLFYVADHVLGLRFMQRLYLPLDGASLYQYVTSTFCHGSWMHLSGNMFFLYLFGKLVEEEEGTLGVLVSYLVTGIGANIISEVFLSDGLALGASGAVFGLFVVSVLIKLKWSVRSIIEALILGQFVVVQVISEARSLGENDGIGHLAHVGGALTGAALVFVVARVLRKKPADTAKGLAAKADAPKAKAKSPA